MLVKVAYEEALDLGIPHKSTRGWVNPATYFLWVDHRRLRRDRRRAARAPKLYGFGVPW